MIRKVLIILTILTIGSAPMYSQRGEYDLCDSWFGRDKLKHLSSSFVLTTTGYYIQTRMVDFSETQSLGCAGMVTVSLGLGKELRDWRKPKGLFSYRDLLADVAGAGLAILFIKVIQ